MNEGDINNPVRKPDIEKGIEEQKKSEKMLVLKQKLGQAIAETMLERGFRVDFLDDMVKLIKNMNLSEFYLSTLPSKHHYVIFGENSHDELGKMDETTILIDLDSYSKTNSALDKFTNKEGKGVNFSGLRDKALLSGLDEKTAKQVATEEFLAKFFEELAPGMKADKIDSMGESEFYHFTKNKE